MELEAMTPLSRLLERVLGPALDPSELPHPLPEGVTVRRNGLVPRVGGWLMGARAPAAGVTLGRTILVPRDSTPSAAVIVHELVHVEQWRDPWFPLRYSAAWVRHGYRNNPYEVEAYRRQREFLDGIPPTTQPPLHA
jgi:hypothetical protein